MSIHADNIRFSYSQDVPVLRGLSVAIEQGECVLLVGPNGAGKSTLLKLLNGILKADDGTITVDSLDTRSNPTHLLASHVAVTFQNPADQIFASTVREEVLFGPRTLRKPDPAILADNSLEVFGLTQFADRHPYDLSPAHRKLLTIASAVATDAPILAFDEPTASLSQPERLVLHNALERLKSQGRTFLIVSHDLDFFVPEATKLLVMNGGTIVYSGLPADLINNPRVARIAGIRIPLAFRIQRFTGIANTGKQV